MIQEVEELSAKLHSDSLVQHRVFVESEIPLFVRGTDQRIAAQVAIMPRSRYAIGSKTENAPTVVGAGHGKRSQVKVVGRVVLVVDDRSYDVRPVKAIAAAAVVILAVVVEGEGLT